MSALILKWGPRWIRELHYVSFTFINLHSFFKLMTQNPHYQLNWRDRNAEKTVTASKFGSTASAWGWETSPLSLGMQMSLVHLTSFHDPCRSPLLPPPSPHSTHPAPLGPHGTVCHIGPGHSIATCPTERGNGIVQSFTSPALQLTESIEQT
ncbi:hypothetical protein CHARACLAT_000087 [Characodon lateralis]|uniref:Uncharacterized protein n=1 Tax=Characodon lateralis TaxID=208331 RepID=A0ABU7EZH4_9TELE|nr:hypothetical protein [Characodon lateralis]